MSRGWWPGRGRLLAAALVSAGWLAALWVALPRLVRAAYEGTGIGLLDGLISGRDYYAVDRYLAAADRLARLGTALLAAGLVALLLLYRFREPLGRAWTRAVRRAPAGPLETVLAAVSLGLVLGGLEASLSYARFRLAGHLTTYNNVDALWMAPLAVAALFAVLAAIAVLAAGGWKRGLSRRITLALCIALGLVGILRGLRLGLHPAAVWAIGIGAGVQLGRLLEGRSGTWRGLVRLAVPGALIVGLVPFLYGHGERYDVVATRPAQSAESGPNVLLLVLDTVRGESLGLGGYERATSPNLDRLARRGVTFARAVAPSPWTLPTHASLFTGRYPHELGVDWDRGVPAEARTLAEALGRAGYVRGGFVANTTNAGRGTGLEQGFDHYVGPPRSVGTWIASAFLPRRLADRLWPRLPTRFQEVNRKYAPEVNRELLAWLDGIEGGPFFAFLNYFDAHAPYEGHHEFLERFDPATRSPVFGEDGRERPAPGRLARDIDAYDSSIALIDDYIGRLLDELDARGRLENTLLIVTSDHGEHLGERGLLDHGNSLYAQLLLVPLIVVWPGRVPEGIRVEAPVSLREVPATVLDLIGAEASLPGSSLAPLWRTGAAPDRDRVRVGTPALAGLRAAPHAGFQAGRNRLGDMKALVDGRLHYILNGDGREELFDLAADPRGRHDLAETEAGLRELPRLRALLRETMAATGGVAEPAREVAAGGPR